MITGQVLVVGSNGAVRAELEAVLAEAGFQATSVNTVAEAREQLAAQRPSVLVLVLDLEYSDGQGPDFLKEIQTKVELLLGHAGREGAHRSAENLVEVKGAVVDFESPRINPRCVENVVDDRKQYLATLYRRPHQVLLASREIRVRQHVE